MAIAIVALISLSVSVSASDCGGTSFSNAQLISSSSISCSFSNGDRYFKFSYGNDNYVARVKYYGGSGSFNLNKNYATEYFRNTNTIQYSFAVTLQPNSYVDYDLYIYDSNENEIGHSSQGTGEMDYVILHPCGGPNFDDTQLIPSGSCSFSKGDRYFKFSERGHDFVIRVKNYDGNGYFTLSVHPASQAHEITVTLTPSEYADYDLHIYENRRLISSSEAGMGQIDQLNLHNPDFR